MFGELPELLIAISRSPARASRASGMRKHLIEASVVAGARQQRGIVEGLRAEAAVLAGVGGEVAGHRGAGAVADEKDLPPRSWTSCVSRPSARTRRPVPRDWHRAWSVIDDAAQGRSRSPRRSLSQLSIGASVLDDDLGDRHELLLRDRALVAAALRHRGGADAAGERDEPGRQPQAGGEAAEREVGVAAADRVDDAGAERRQRRTDPSPIRTIAPWLPSVTDSASVPSSSAPSGRPDSSSGRPSRAGTARLRCD